MTDVRGIAEIVMLLHWMTPDQNPELNPELNPEYLNLKWTILPSTSGYLLIRPLSKGRHKPWTPSFGPLGLGGGTAQDIGYVK